MLKKITKNARDRFLSWLPYIAQLTAQRDKIIQENREHFFNKSHIYSGELGHCLVHNDDWVRNIAQQLLEHKSKKEKLVEDAFYNIIYYRSKEEIDRFIKALSLSKNTALKDQFTNSLKDNLINNPNIINFYKYSPNCFGEFSFPIEFYIISKTIAQEVIHKNKI